MTFKFVYNALLSFPHLFLFIHAFILSHWDGFFVISHGLAPPLSDSLFYIVAHAVLTSLLSECYYPEKNKLELCYPVEHISLFSTRICWRAHMLYSTVLLVPNDTTSLAGVLGLPSDILM